MTTKPETEAQRLEPLRIKIDAIDLQLLDLLSQRAQLAMEVGHVKQEFGSVVYRPEREQQVLEKVAKNNPGPIANEGVQHIWREIMSACRAIEANISVAYLGPAGTFSEEATQKFFGHSIEFAPRGSLDEVFRDVESGTCAYGLVPIENSSEGAVSRTLDLLLASRLNICGEVSIPVTHTLMTQHGTLEGTTHVYAHPQALAQCQQWLNQHASHLHREAISSNAQAAVEAAKHGNIAAIASLSAAKTYGLKVVQQGIQDDVHNRTRFIVIGFQTSVPTGHDQTSVIVSVNNEAGAVYRMLEPFAKHGVSMTRLESRPARTGAWEYHFYIDMHGHREDVAVKNALQELENLVVFYKCLGSYPKSKQVHESK
jgi:chorismate mutase / prephenate dehydratase